MNISSQVRRLGAGLAVAVAIAFSALFTTAQPVAADSPRDAVYIATNEASGNAILVFNRAANGTLSPGGSVPTGGRGSGFFFFNGVGSQGSVIQSDNGRWLFAVNAGSNEISSFAVTANGLTLVSKVASGGLMPVSLTVHQDILYVLNGGDPGNITGF